MLIPIAADGHPCAGLDFSPDMLAEADRKASGATGNRCRSRTLSVVLLLVSVGGLRLVERLGDWSGRPSATDALLRLFVCESDWSKAGDCY